jgi:hypothetical protein
MLQLNTVRRGGWRPMALTITLTPNLKSIPNFVSSAPL